MDIHLVTHSLWEVITIATVSAIVSLITIVGNVLVMLSFKVNSQLKTVNNYYLLSLAAADLIIGVFSMNLYTSYILMGYWALGNLACDLWLACGLCSHRSNAAKSAATTNDEWSKAGQLTTFNSYASSDDEDRPVSPGGFQPSFRNQACETIKSGVGSESEQLSSYEEDSFFQTPPKSNSQKSSKCVSYKFKPVVKDTHVEHHSKNGDTKMASSTFSSAESMSVPSTSSTSKPIDATLKNQITKRKRMVLIKERKAAQTLSAILLAFILTWTPL
ncbi:Muscarinic acetylcholine receptor M5 [Larimichthys crocea]|uniref:Muscarinic acetylcholine receptor M5 n=1 Tax=Larimichthys crocea TaxID=215358 RepID=A0A6G0IEZ0_LARCR|nr:Muscarinic acetylcholine receptor M5 [Larimichthys crocea]